MKQPVSAKKKKGRTGPKGYSSQKGKTQTVYASTPRKKCARCLTADAVYSKFCRHCEGLQ